MSFFTFGLYWLFCFHRSWVLYRGASGERVMPLVRALFAVFFLYSLLSRVDRQIRLSGRSYEWWPFWLVAVFILATAISFWAAQLIQLDLLRGWGVVMAMEVVWLLVISRMQMAINFCVGDLKGESNTRISLWNWFWMFFGILYWVVIFSVLVLLLVALLLGIPFDI